MIGAVGQFDWLDQTLAAGAVALLVAGSSQAQSACEVAHVAASDGFPFQGFGWAVDIDGDTALVGGGEFAGSAYIFRFDGATWLQEQKLVPSSGQSQDWFGSAVAIEGDTAMIGAFGHNGNCACGAAYVFRYDGSKWIEELELQPSDGALGDAFGFSVSMTGDVAIIGAPGDDDNGVQSGSAYVFRFDPESSRWVEEQQLLAPDGDSGDFFGWSAAVGRDVAIVGAVSDFNAAGQGAAYVFRYDPKTSQWYEEQKLLPFEAGGHDAFGKSVSIDSDAVLIGAPDGGAGSAYVFRFDRVAGIWVGQQQLVAAAGAAGDKFGGSVAIMSNTALVGAFASNQAGSDHGAAHLFRFDGKNWVEQQTLVPAPGDWTAFFGFSVALSADTAVVGAYGENVGAGGAYMYAGLSGIDCNANGASDTCDILSGASQDTDADGVPDECACPWDLDDGGNVGVADFQNLLLAWGTSPGGPPDFNGDGDVGIVDFLDLLAHWGPCP